MPDNDDAAAGAAAEPTIPTTPKGVYAPGAIEAGEWLEGKIVEMHDLVLVVAFEKPDGNSYNVTIDNPRWNCERSGFAVGSSIAVRFDPGAIPFPRA